MSQYIIVIGMVRMGMKSTMGMGSAMSMRSTIAAYEVFIACGSSSAKLIKQKNSLREKEKEKKSSVKSTLSPWHIDCCELTYPARSC